MDGNNNQSQKISRKKVISFKGKKGGKKKKQTDAFRNFDT